MTPAVLKKGTAIVLAAIFSAGLLYLVFNQEGGEAARSGIPASEQHRKPANSATPVQRMPDGIQRPLSQYIPAVGRVTGARWIPQHEFLMSDPKNESKREWVHVKLDVLVDAEGRFLAARRGGTRFDTRLPDSSLHQMLRYATYDEFTKRTHLDATHLPAVQHVTPARLPLDDPNLGDGIKYLMQRYYVRYGNVPQEEFLRGMEDTYYCYEVQLAGEATPRFITVRRYSDGKVWKSQDGSGTWPALPEPYISGTNSNGASAIYIVRENHPTEWREPVYFCLTEPWDGPCPWPEERLDPAIAHDRLNEFYFPDEAPLAGMYGLVHREHLSAEPDLYMQAAEERALKNKLDRIARESASQPR